MTKRVQWIEPGDVVGFTIYAVIEPERGWKVHYHWWEIDQAGAAPKMMASEALGNGDLIEDVHNVISDVWALGWKALGDQITGIINEELPFP
jgi:hypothetical protein